MKGAMNYLSGVMYMLCIINGVPYVQVGTRDFGTWSIDKKLFDYIRNTLSDGSTILELGSGWVSGEFSKYYTVYSIEHDARWLNRYNTHYIYAPIVHGWYSVEILQNELPEEYDLILVDGPTGKIGRGGFFTHLDLFRTDVPIIFDDVNRYHEHELMINVAIKLQRSYTIFSVAGGKQFGVLQKSES